MILIQLSRKNCFDMQGDIYFTWITFQSNFSLHTNSLQISIWFWILFKGQSDNEEKMEISGDTQDFYDEEQQQYYEPSYQVPPVQDDDENSFDPSDFFMHSALADEAQHRLQQGDINEDLQVSDSDEEENQGGNGGNDNEGFDIDEFL